MEGYQRDIASILGSQIGIKHSRINDAGLDVAEVQLKAPKPSEYQMAEFNKTLEICKRYGCLSFCFQDERHCSSDPGMPQPAAMKEFRAYLNRQYGSLAKLNASWDKNYQSWDDVIPVLTKDLTPNTKNIAPWVDLRLFVADRCFEIDKYKSDKLREAFGKDFAVGLDGFVACPLVIPYGGLDIGRLLAEGVFNHYCPYEQDHLIASMVTSKMVKFVGWGMSKDEYMGNPWRDLFRGHWGTYRFQGMTYVSPFGWFNPAAFWIEEGTREIRGGIGKLLMGAKRQFTPIAILYSYPSMMTTAGAGVWVEKGNPHLMWHPAERSRDAFDRMLLKCGNGAFKYVTDKQAANGHLKGTKLLIIPHFMGIALDDNTCNAIKEFVADGGYVVADMAPAVCDEHGKLREKGGLDDLFGVTRSSFAYVQRASDYLVGVTQPDPLVPANAWFVGEWYEKNLKVTDGQALGMHVFEKIPAFVVKDTGKGRTLLLNFLNSSTVRRNGEPETEDIDLMQSILKTAGVRGDVSGPSGCELNVFRDGNAEYVGVYPYCGNSQSLPGDMQMALGITGETKNAGTKEGMISFKDNKDTYDVRQGKYLGRIQKTPIPNRLNAALFARLDYKIEDIHITAESAQAGEAVRIHVSLNTSAAPGRHVVHLEIIEPNGKRSFLYSENMETYNGNAEKVVHTALNDPRGAWKIMAREVVSGKTAETSFQLK